MTSAFGLRFLRRSFAISEPLDRAFALGWPYLRIVGESELASAMPEGMGFSFSEKDALARVRAKLETAGLTKSNPGLGKDDARAFARHVIPFGFVRGWDETDLFLFEGVVGADVLADQMIASLEEISKVEWRRANQGALETFYRLGFTLLRADADAVLAPETGFHARLETVFGRNADEGGPLSRAVDLVLHGAEGARRSAEKHGRTDADIRTAHALFVHDDPAMLTAIAKGERFDRACAARLAFLGDEPTLDAILKSWFAVGNKSEQTYFLRTVGQIAGDAMLASTREAVRSSKVKDAATAWLASRAHEPPPEMKAPGAVKRDTLVTCDGDEFEFGFVLLAAETAEKLRGEDDHTTLAVNVDPTTNQAFAAEAYGANAAFFCLAQRVAMAQTPEGALVFHGGEQSEDDIFAALEGAPTRNWLPVTTIDLPSGRLMGLSASSTLADARADGKVIELTLPKGTYEVRHARDDEEGDNYVAPLVWLRRVS